MWALAGVRRLSWQGSPGLEWSGRGLCPRSSPGSLLPYVLQSQVPRDWIGAGAVFHSPEVLGSRGSSRVGPCGCWARLCWQGSPGLEWSRRDLCPRSGPGSLLPYVSQSQVPRDWIGLNTFIMGINMSTTHTHIQNNNNKENRHCEVKQCNTCIY